MIHTIFYGKLEQILEYEIPDSQFWGILRGKITLLAIITPCVTNGKDATKQLTTYTETTTQIVTDLKTVKCVVGRVLTWNRWGIIDCSGDSSRTEFVPSNIPHFLCLKMSLVNSLNRTISVSRSCDCYLLCQLNDMLVEQTLLQVSPYQCTAVTRPHIISLQFPSMFTNTGQCGIIMWCDGSHCVACHLMVIGIKCASPVFFFSTTQMPPKKTTKKQDAQRITDLEQQLEITCQANGKLLPIWLYIPDTDENEPRGT